MVGLFHFHQVKLRLRIEHDTYLSYMEQFGNFRRSNLLEGQSDSQSFK